MPIILEPVTPTERDARLPSEGSRTLARLMRGDREVHLRHGQEDADRITLPANVARLVQEVLEQVGQGQSVVVLPVETELITSQAAELVGVSRPFLIQLLEQGEIPFHLVGTHRRVRLTDVLRYNQEGERRIGVMRELIAENVALDL